MLRCFVNVYWQNTRFNNGIYAKQVIVLRFTTKLIAIVLSLIFVPFDLGVCS